LDALARFLKSPVKAFCNQTLKFGFDDESVTSEDCEPFGFDSLQSYLRREALLQDLKNDSPNDLDAFFAGRQLAMAQRGQLPLGGFAQASFDALAEPVNGAWQRYQALLPEWPTELDPHALKLPPFTVSDGASYQLTGELNQLRSHENQKDAGLIFLTAQTLIKDKKIKYANLLLPWLQHLAASALIQSFPKLQTVVVASDAIIEIPPIAPREARRYLATLIEAYHLGMAAPLPVACKTAFAWLNAPDKAEEAAIAQYEGTDWIGGEVDYDAYLQRFFPNFADLNASGHSPTFEHWAETLYRPIFTHIKQQSGAS
jgi:exodeoxyribonuclease V gamma subunit